MPTTRPHRNIKRVLMALVVVVLLPLSYVASYGCANWLQGRGIIDSARMVALEETIFRPLGLYFDSGLPGAEYVLEFGFWCYQCGSEMKWSEIREA